MQIKKHGNDGLKGLDSLNNHPGAKNMEASIRSGRSKQSTLTSVRRRFNSQINVDKTDVEPIEEQRDENENG